MKVELRERTEETVRIYFETVRRQGLDRTLPQRAKTAEEAVEDYRQTLLPGAKSYGRTIWVDGTMPEMCGVMPWMRGENRRLW